MRIVSLLPSATEIVYALGLADSLVGVTFECDEPPAARREKAVVVAGSTPRAWARERSTRPFVSGWRPARTCTPCTPVRWPHWTPTSS